MFTINNRKWKIEPVKADSKTLQRSDGSWTIAMCDSSTNTIYINNKLSGRLLEKVLLHEITHACMFSYDIYLDIDTEELICNVMANYGNEIVSKADLMFGILSKASKNF